MQGGNLWWNGPRIKNFGGMKEAGLRRNERKVCSDEVTEKASTDPSGLLALQCVCRILTNWDM